MTFYSWHPPPSTQLAKELVSFHELFLVLSSLTARTNHLLTHLLIKYYFHVSNKVFGLEASGKAVVQLVRATGVSG